MPFHRFQDPTYNRLGGAFPGTIGTQTYSRINVTNGGIGGGDGSANADGAKGSGPNAGTYLVAFGEDATSSAANRGLRAMAQNTDAIDNVIRGSIPYVKRVTVTTVSSSIDVALGTEMFVGEQGLGASAPVLAGLVHIENTDGTPVAGTTQPTIILIHDGTGINVVGVPADGFYATPTIRFSASIPAGTYVLFVGVRTSYADLLETKLHYTVNELLANRTYNTQNWYSFTQGLNEKYRRSTTRAAGALDTPGSGAVITRDGKAVTVEMVEHPWATPVAGADPFDAGIIVQLPSAFGTPGTATDYDRTLPGNLGYVYVTNRRGGNNPLEYTKPSQPLAAFAILNPMDVHSGSSGPWVARTFIPEGISATLNPDGAHASRVQVFTPYYFRESSYHTTAILLGFDGLLITIAGVTQWYIIDSIVSDGVVTVVFPGGTPAGFSTATSATIQWVQFSACFGGAGRGSSVDSKQHWAGFVWTDPMRLMAPSGSWPDVADGYQEDAPIHITKTSGDIAFRAGVFNPTTGSYDIGWFLTAGGVLYPGPSNTQSSTSSTGGLLLKANQGSITDTHALITGGSNSVLIDVWAASCVFLTHGTLTGDVYVSIGLTHGPNWSGTSGDHIEVFLYKTTTAHAIDLGWDLGQFAFSGNDGVVPAGIAATYKWTGTRSFNGKFYMTRTDYPL
jgi:hypothetical protein